MPAKKSKSCWGDVMGEFKRGQLHSGTGKAGKKGKVVTNPAQAKAIAASTCDNTEMDQSNYGCMGDCGCEDCGARAKKKQHMMALGYSEKAAETIVTEMFGPEFSEEETIRMVMTRLKVIIGRCGDILQTLDHAMMSAKMSGGEVEMEPWQIDKITMAADYLSAVADNTKFGDGVKIEMDDSPYGEKPGLWENIHRKRERIKRGSGERMRRPGEKGAPSAQDLKDADTSDNKEGSKSRRQGEEWRDR